MVRFSELIEASFEWTITQLFRPLRPKKWVFLALCALCAGALNYQSLNINLPLDRGERGRSGEESSEVESAKEAIAEFKTAVIEFKQKPYAVAVGVAAAVVLLGSLLFLNWLYSRFSFVFLEDVVTNDASVRIPFKNTRSEGNSFFLFNLAFGAFYLAPCAAVVWQAVRLLKARGVFADFGQFSPFEIFLMIAPYVFLLAAVGLAALIVRVLVSDFVLVVMYKQRMSVWPALAAGGRFVGRNMKDVLVYLLVKLGLALAGGMAYGIACLLSLLGFFLAIGGIALCAVLGVALVPEGYQWVVATIAVIAAAPVILAMQLFFLCLQLPLAVFFRTLSIKFVGRLEPAWDLFNSERARGGQTV